MNLLLKLLCVISLQSVVSFQSQCKNSKNQPGKCVSINSCPTFKKIMDQSVLSPDDFTFLLSSKCDGDLFCCADLYENEPLKRVEIPKKLQSIKQHTTQNKKKLNHKMLPIPGSGQCGIHSADKIYGGRNVGIDEYPWMVLLEYENTMKKRKFFGCGGTLINNRYVLTAAHCIQPSAKLISVRLGEWDKSTDMDCNEFDDCADPVQDIPVQQTIVHESFKPSGQNTHHDIALIRLARPVTFSYFIKPICLPSNPRLSQLSEVGRLYTVAGWGRTESGRHSDKKLKVDIRGVESSKCAERYEKRQLNEGKRKIISSQICAGGEAGKDSCGGDSGGGLFSEFRDENGKNYVYLMGLVSYGATQCGEKDWPAVYTRITSYLDWIERNIRP